MSTFDFSHLTPAGSWTDANFVQGGTAIKVSAQNANGALSALAWTSGTGTRGALLTGRTWGTTLTAQITVNGVNGHVVTGDEADVGIVVASGGNQWFGYYALCRNGLQALVRQDDSTGVPGQTGSHTTMGTGTSAAMAEGDTFLLSLNTSTGALVLSHNGTSIITATDTTYAAGMTAAFCIANNNNAGTGISSLVTTGDSVATTTTLNQIESRVMRGMNRGCMRGM